MFDSRFKLSLRVQRRLMAGSPTFCSAASTVSSAQPTPAETNAWTPWERTCSKRRENSTNIIFVIIDLLSKHRLWIVCSFQITIKFLISCNSQFHLSLALLLGILSTSVECLPHMNDQTHETSNKKGNPSSWLCPSSNMVRKHMKTCIVRTWPCCLWYILQDNLQANTSTAACNSQSMLRSQRPKALATSVQVDLLLCNHTTCQTEMITNKSYTPP